MKKTLLLLFSALGFATTQAQGTLCDSSGNLVIITNYDGGIMNINVDVNIPNLKIGVVTYEAVQINLSGTFVNNVTAVQYAGYNGNNDNCGTGVTNTSINGAPGGATTGITLYPTAGLSNPNGYAYIICGYSCDLTTNQGGCNTADQIEDYFLNTVYPGSILRSHRIQYNCISNTINLSSGGNCCALAQPLAVLVNSTHQTCYGVCDAVATAIAGGGQPPYIYQWTGGPSSDVYSGLCPGTYTVTVTDGLGNTATQQTTVTGPAAPISKATSVVNPDNGTCNGTISVSATGGNGGPYTYQWPACGNNSTAPSVIGVCAGTCCVTVTDSQGCQDTLCVTVPSVSGVSDLLQLYQTYIYPNPSENGIFSIESFNGKLDEMKISVTDMTGRNIPFAFRNNSATKAQLSVNAVSGLYYVNFATPAGNITKKVVLK